MHANMRLFEERLTGNMQKSHAWQGTKMSVLHVLPSLLSGGTETLLFDILQRLDGQVLDISICCTHGPGQSEWHQRFQAVGVRTYVLPYSLHRWQLVFNVLRFLRGAKFDIVHIHCYDGNEIWARLAAILARVPLILTYDHDIHYHGIGWRGKIAWYVLNRFTHRNVTISEECRRFRMACCGGQPHKVVKIVNGVDTQRFHPRLRDKGPACRLQLGIDPTRPVVGAIGRLVDWKRFHLFVQAAVVSSQRTDAQFVLRGEGPLRADLSGLAMRVGANKLHFVRWLPKVEDIYGVLDILVLTSSPQEGFGLVLAEAMASGVPVIGMMDNPTHVEVIGDCGLLVPPEPQEIASAIGRLLDDTRLAAVLAKRGRKRAEECFDINRTARELQALYLRAALGRNAAGV